MSFEERINQEVAIGSELFSEGKFKEAADSARKVRNIWGESVRASELALQMSERLLAERKEKYKAALKFESDLEGFAATGGPR